MNTTAKSDIQNQIRALLSEQAERASVAEAALRERLKRLTIDNLESELEWGRLHQANAEYRLAVQMAGTLTKWEDAKSVAHIVQYLEFETQTLFSNITNSGQVGVSTSPASNLVAEYRRSAMAGYIRPKEYIHGEGFIPALLALFRELQKYEGESQGGEA